MELGDVSRRDKEGLVRSPFSEFDYMHTNSSGSLPGLYISANTFLKPKRMALGGHWYRVSLTAQIKRLFDTHFVCLTSVSIILVLITYSLLCFSFHCISYFQGLFCIFCVFCVNRVKKLFVLLPHSVTSFFPIFSPYCTICLVEVLHRWRGLTENILEER